MTHRFIVFAALAAITITGSACSQQSQTPAQKTGEASNQAPTAVAPVAPTSTPVKSIYPLSECKPQSPTTIGIGGSQTIVIPEDFDPSKYYKFDIDVTGYPVGKFVELKFVNKSAKYPFYVSGEFIGIGYSTKKRSEPCDGSISGNTITAYVLVSEKDPHDPNKKTKDQYDIGLKPVTTGAYVIFVDPMIINNG